VRYYERRRLLPKPPRSGGGYRQYPLEAVSRLRFVRRAQELGFTLEEIGELLSLRAGSPRSCAAVERKAREAIKRLDARLATLTRVRQELENLAAQCRDRRAAELCPFLDELSESP